MGFGGMRRALDCWMYIGMIKFGLRNHSNASMAAPLGSISVSDFSSTETSTVLLIYQHMNHSVTQGSTDSFREAGKRSQPPPAWPNVTADSRLGPRGSRGCPIVHWCTSTSPLHGSLPPGGPALGLVKAEVPLAEIYGRISFPSQTKQRLILYVHTLLSGTRVESWGEMTFAWGESDYTALCF